MNLKLNNLVELAKNTPKKNIAVINPIDDISLGGIHEAVKHNLVSPILLGKESKIREVAQNNGFSLDNMKIVDCESEEEILAKMVALAQNKEVDIIMKGSIHSDHLLSQIVKKENQLREGLISHIFALDMPTYHKTLFITDCAINIAPSLEHKAKILMNSIKFLHKLGIAKPKVAILSATEVPNEKMISSTDAYALANNPDFKDLAIVEGPLAFDNAISAKSAQIKKITSQIAGDVDLLIMPNIESGNMLAKSLVYLGNAQIAGVVVGAKLPVVLTSRADDEQARLLSVVLAKLSV
jgi:phosphotransacetylase